MSKNLMIGTIAAILGVLAVGALIFAGFQFFFGSQTVFSATPATEATATMEIVIVVTATPATEEPTEESLATATPTALSGVRSFRNTTPKAGGGPGGLAGQAKTRIPPVATAVVQEGEKCFADLPGIGKQEVPCILTTPVVIGGTPQPTEVPCTNPGGILCPATRTPAPNIVESVATRVAQAVQGATPTPVPGPLESVGSAVGGLIGWWCILIPAILLGGWYLFFKVGVSVSRNP